MAKNKPKPPRLLSNTFLLANNPLGGSEAERESDTLPRYFIREDETLAPIRQNHPGLLIYVGPKGVGKSAVQSIIEARRDTIDARIISIHPKELALFSIAEASAMREIIDGGVSRNWLMVSLWRFLFVAEILHREDNDRNVLVSWLISLFSAEERAVRTLIEVAYSQEPVARRFSRLVELLGPALTMRHQETSVTLSARPQNAKPEVASASMLKIVHHVSEKMEERLRHNYLFLIDDLDQGWEGGDFHHDLLKGLFTAIRTLSHNRKVSFVVSIREDIFRALRLDEPDKIRSAVLRLEWTRPLIEQLLLQRIKIFGTGIDPRELGTWQLPIVEGGVKLKAFWNVVGDNPRRAIQVVEGLIVAGRNKGLSRVDQTTMSAILVEMSQAFLSDLDWVHSHTRPGLCFVAQSFRQGMAEFDLAGTDIVCADLLARLEKEPQGRDTPYWARDLANTPVKLMEALLEMRFLFFKERREAPAHEYRPSLDIINEATTMFAVNPVFQCGLGLSSP